MAKKKATAFRNRIVGHGEEAPDQLLANPANWRIHPQAQQDALAAVLGKVGWVSDVIVNQRTGHVVDGHLRVALAITNNEPSVPVKYVDLAPDEEALILATLDPLAAMAATDKDQLDALLRSLPDQDAAVRSLLDSIARDNGIVRGDPKPDPGADMDRADELRKKWGVERGQVWVVGEHRIMCGDATDAGDVERLMGGENPRLMVTSPPYNQNIDTFRPSGMQREQPAFVERMASAYQDSIPENDYRTGQIEMLELWARCLAPDGSIFYNHKIRYREKCAISPIEWLAQLSFPIRQEIIWDRGSSITMNARMFIPADERIYWLRVGDNFVFNDEIDIKAWSSVWRISAKNEVSISAAFALEIPTRCIRAVSEVEDAVCDPYLGTGTTLVACEQLGRRGFGMEIEPKYVAVSLERLAGMGLDATLQA